MKKITSLFLTLTMLFFCYRADAQNAKPAKPVSKNNIFAVLAKERAAKQINSSTRTRSKKETQKKLATYTYVDMNEQTGQITDTTEKYFITWGDNGIPTQVRIEGTDDEFIEGKSVPFRLIYTDFVKVNSSAGSEFEWFIEDADFDAKAGLLEVYNNNQWQNFAKLEKTINTQEFVTEQLGKMFVMGNWVNYSKETYTYDANGNQTEGIEQVWEVNKWVNEGKWVEMYDADNHNLGYEGYTWENNQWEMDYGYKLVVTKNTSNQVAVLENHYYDNTSKEWIISNRQSYVWDGSGKVEEAIQYNLMNGEWKQSIKYDNISWKSFDANEFYGYPLMIGGSLYNSLESYFYNDFDSSWTISSKYVNVFTGNNITESMQLYYNGTDWDTSTKTTYAYYPNGDEKETKNWNKIDGEWKVNYGYGSKNTYDNDGDILTMISLDWDSENEVFVEEDMEIYTYTNVTVGIAKNHSNKASVNVYPNPVTAGNITLALANNTSASANITVYN
ncbi:MAG: hypothetical protein ACXWDO_08875, partial [Bacteroidia bacterium]